MNSRPYPAKQSCPNWHGIAKIITCSWRQGFQLKFLFSLLAATFFIISSALAQGPCPNSNCTSGDIRITKVELLLADGSQLPSTCTYGGTMQVKLRVTFDVTSQTRYGFLVTANVYINNNLTGITANCDPSDMTQGTHTMDLSQYVNGNPILWPCGSSIQLKDIYSAWSQQATGPLNPSICSYLNPSTGAVNNCSAIAPKCMFYGVNNVLVITAPLISSFAAQEGSCINLKRTWTFTSTTTGGNTPYTYTWNFGDGSPLLVTNQNPVTHDYAYSPTSTNVNVTLSVQDASMPTPKTSTTQPQTITITSCCVASTDPTGASAASPSICTGGSTNVSVTGGSLGTNASWKWYVGGCGNGNSIGTGATINVSPAQTTTYFVRAEGDCGTTNCASVTVTVKTPSTNPTGATAASPIICSGGTDISITGGSLGTNASWKWYAGGCGNGASIGTGATINVSPTQTTTYYVRAEGDCGNTSCASVTVTVKTPSTDPTGANASSPTICNGGSSNLSIVGGSLGTGASWKWYVGGCGNGNSIGTGTTINVSPTQTTTYFVRAEGDCGNTNCASVTITVNTSSTAPSSATAASSTICVGGNTNLNVIGGSLGTNASWKWYVGGCGNGASIGTGTNINVNPTQTTTYYVRAEGACGNTSCASVTVTVKTPSTNPSGATATPNTLCLGGSTNINVVGGSLGTNASWKWYAGGCGNGASIGTGATINVSPTQTTTYYVRAEGDCGPTSCASVTITVKTPSSNPTGATAASNVICNGNNTNISVTGGSLGTNASWKWYVGSCGNGNPIGTGATINVSPTQTTTYYVRAEGDCGNTSCVSVTVTVKNPSVNPSGATATAPTICLGSSTTISVVGGSLGTNAVWKWYAGGCASGASIGTGTSLTVSPTQTTTYYVRAEGDCNNTNCASIQVVVNPTSVGGTLATDKTICAGSNSGLLTLSGNVGTVQRWESSTTSDTSGFSAISGTAGLTSYTSGVLAQNTWFRVVVKSGVCSEATSSTIKISIQQPIGDNNIAASQLICIGFAPDALTGNLCSGGSGYYNYQWQMKTTGSWSNISGATGKDYAPGQLYQTCQYRRIVSAGSACPASTSADVLVSISPESQVYAISGNNYCSTTPHSGSINLASSYPGVSYQLIKQTSGGDLELQDPQIGTGSSLTWTGLDGGYYYVIGKGTAPTYCTTRSAAARVLEFNCSVFYTLTQGYYGGKNGKSCPGTNPVTTIFNLLGGVDLTIGSTNSITIPATLDGAKKLNQSLPGGSTAGPLPTGNCIITTGCFSYPNYLTKQGRINNVLLSQTIVLSLNTRWSSGALLYFPIRSGYLTTQKMSGCGPDAVLYTGCEAGNIEFKLMNQNVVNYLGPNGTVGDLLKLANYLLGGDLIPGVNGVPSYADVNDAIDAINEGFDEGRRFLDYYDKIQTCEELFPAPALPPPIGTLRTTITATTMTSTATTTNTSTIAKNIPAQSPAESETTVSAYPNPFTDNVNFVITTKQSGQGVLEVFNMAGQKVKTVFQGFIPAGTRKYSLYLPIQQQTSLFYIFRMGNDRRTGKLINLPSR